MESTFLCLLSVILALRYPLLFGGCEGQNSIGRYKTSLQGHATSYFLEIVGSELITS